MEAIFTQRHGWGKDGGGRPGGGGRGCEAEDEAAEQEGVGPVAADGGRQHAPGTRCRITS